MAITLRRRAHQLRDWLEEVEQTWLGWSLPPARRALADADFKPDERSAYCGRCGASIGPGEATDRGCGSCRNTAVATDGVVRLGPYADQLRDWILAIKYRQWAEMADVLGRQLGGALAASNLLEPARTVVVPMPMPWQRRIYRGIDHARLVAAAVAADLRVPLLRVLSKANGRPQVSLSPSERKQRTGRGLHIRRRISRLRLDGLDVVLVDDVRTTGASLRAATRLLRRLGPRRVVAGVVAVSDDRARRTRTRDADGARGAPGRAAGPTPIPSPASLTPGPG